MTHSFGQETRIQLSRDKPRSFSSIEHESIIKRCFDRIGAGIRKIMAATMIVTSAAPVVGAITSCGGQETEKERISNGTVRTGDDGKASFEANGNTFSINVYDYETQTPVSGIDLLYYLRGDAGICILRDSENRYTTNLINLETGESADSSESMQQGLITGALTFGWDTNVYMNKNWNACGFGNYEQITGKGIDELYLEKDKDGGVLKNNYENKNPAKPVKLKDLDSEIEDALIESLLALGMGKEAAKLEKELSKVKIAMLAKFMAKGMAETALLGFQAVAVVMEYCKDAELRSWKRYYEGLGYGQDAEFEIWESKKGTGISIGPLELIKNAILIVLPKEGSGNWVTETGIVNGTVQTAYLDSPSIATVTENDSMGMFPLLYKNLGGFPVTGPTTASFTFVVGTSKGMADKMPYNVAVTTWSLNTMKIKVSPNTEEIYDLEFDFTSCLPGFLQKTMHKDADKDEFGSKLRIRGFCGDSPEGYEGDMNDCNDSDQDVNPFSTEICDDKKDNNCNEQTDENCSSENSEQKKLPSNCEFVYYRANDNIVNFNTDGKVVGITTIKGVEILDLATKETEEIQPREDWIFYPEKPVYVWDGRVYLPTGAGLIEYTYLTGTKEIKIPNFVSFSNGMILVHEKDSNPPDYAGKCPEGYLFKRAPDNIWVSDITCLYAYEVENEAKTFVKPPPEFANVTGASLASEPKFEPFSYPWLVGTFSTSDGKYPSAKYFSYNFESQTWVKPPFNPTTPSSYGKSMYEDKFLFVDNFGQVSGDGIVLLSLSTGSVNVIDTYPPSTEPGWSSAAVWKDKIAYSSSTEAYWRRMDALDVLQTLITKESLKGYFPAGISDPHIDFNPTTIWRVKLFDNGALVQVRSGSIDSLVKCSLK